MRYCFPWDPPPVRDEEYWEECRKLRDMTPEEKIRLMEEINAAGQEFLNTSPKGPEIREQLRREEEEGHRIWRDLFANYLAQQAKNLPAHEETPPCDAAPAL